jgi:uncharacterized protein with PIN domain
MEFFVDEMVVGLTRWLRILGFDTIDMRSYKKEGMNNLLGSRYFITASKKHYEEWRGQKKVFIRFDSISERLNYLDSKLDIFNKIEFLSRCLLCNSKILSLKKSEIVDDVPKRVLKNFDNFYHCPKCNKIYWQGGHVKRIFDKLKRMGVPINLNKEGEKHD